MISAGLHSDMESPPDIPEFHSSAKKPRKDSLIETITGAAVTVAKALKEPNGSVASQIETSTHVSTEMFLLLKMPFL